MKTLRFFALAPLAATAAAFAILPARTQTARASSHAEAPAIADDPAMDNTDVWAWQDSASTITIVTAWNGVSTPSGGPNYKKWVPYPQGLYEIHIDTDGDGEENITYQFLFHNNDNGDSTFLRATGPSSGYERLQSAGDPAQKFAQTYDVVKLQGDRRNGNILNIAPGLPVAPPNTGPQLTWGRKGGVNQSIAGTVAVANGSTTIVGTNTKFTTMLTTGQVIQLGNQAGTSYTIDANTATTGIIDDTHLTVTAAFSGPSNTATTVLTLQTQTLIGAGSTTAPGNVAAPAGTNDYENQIAASAIQTNIFGASTETVFVGPRADAFFVDLGPTFDRLKIRTIGTQPGIANAGTRSVDVGQYGGAFNTLCGKNVEVIAIQIPTTSLSSFTPKFPNGTSPLGGNYIGVWASSSRAKVRVLPINKGTGQLRQLTAQSQATDTRDVASGSYVQVSRLGNPLVNELFIPFDKKDAWNADIPSNDTQHWAQYFSNPEVAGIIHAVYGVAVPSAPRNDLQFLFAPDTLKVKFNLGTPLTASDPGFIGNGQGPLLGRTLADDVVDIYLKAGAGFLVQDASVDGVGFASLFNMPSFFPPAAPAPNSGLPQPGITPLNGLLGDGVDYGTDGAGAGFTVTPTTFPYMQTPWDGQELNNDYFQSPRHN